MLPESIIDSIFNTAVKFVVEKMTARVGNDFQEAVHRCFDSLVHWLAGVLVIVGCKEVWDFPDVTSSTHDGVSNHIVEVIARHWPFTDNVTAINAESSCFIQVSDFGHQTAVIIPMVFTCSGRVWFCWPFVFISLARFIFRLLTFLFHFNIGA